MFTYVPPGVHRRARLAGAIDQHLPQSPANRIGKRNVRDDSVTEKSKILAALRAVEKLIDHHDVGRLVFLLQASDGADADDPAHAELFHAVNIGAMIQFARQDFVPATMSGQKDDVLPAKPPRQKLVRRFAERCRHRDPPFPLDACHLIQPAAANHTKFHDELLSLLTRMCACRVGSGIRNLGAQRKTISTALGRSILCPTLTKTGWTPSRVRNAQPTVSP